MMAALSEATMAGSTCARATVGTVVAQARGVPGAVAARGAGREGARPDGYLGEEPQRQAKGVLGQENVGRPVDAEENAARADDASEHSLQLARRAWWRTRRPRPDRRLRARGESRVRRGHRRATEATRARSAGAWPGL